MDGFPAAAARVSDIVSVAIDPTGRLLIAAHIAPLRLREGGALRMVPAGMTSFRIDLDGRLEFLCRTPVETNGETLFWSGIVPL